VIPQYPLFAIRELVVNAVAHREYFVHGSRIIIKMFADRIEFSSPGGFPADITPENIVDRQYSRNPIIVKILNMVRYIEAIGDGIDRVLEVIKTHPLKPQMPVFRDVGNNVIVILHSADMSKLDFLKIEKLALNDKEKKIVNILKYKARINSGDIQKEFDVSRDTANRYLKKLMKLGLIRKEGKGKATYYTFNR
jgi:ATP-dependent DNA helicase RecG